MIKDKKKLIFNKFMDDSGVLFIYRYLFIFFRICNF